MVESRTIISLFFGKFDSPYIGSPFMISGNQIYSAIIRENGMEAIKNATKISHGVFHNIPANHIDYRGKATYNRKDWRGWPVGEKINMDERTINTYDDFFKLRSYQTPFIKNTDAHSDMSRLLRSHRFILKNGDKIDSFHADRLSFFVISGARVEISELHLGAKRNMGFGSLTITNSYSFDIDSLDFSVFGDNQKLIDTAKSGITGILNHKKYGYGEFKAERWKEDKWLIKLSTPLCLRSTIEGARNYDILPPFMVNDTFRRHRENIWRKGKIETLYCVSDGSVFLYAN